MDLVAESLFRESRNAGSQFKTEKICPKFSKRFTRFPGFGRTNTAFNGDRLINRFWDYPRFLKRQVNKYDLFHICDHSYSQLVNVLPPERTGVFCHDLDTFRCILEPNLEPRPKWFRKMTKQILTGFQKAAVVFYTTEIVREAICRHSLLDETKLTKAPYGISPTFENPNGKLLPDALRNLNQPYLLHVGSCIPRKRIDVLLNVFAEVCKSFPEISLVKVGDPWTASQEKQIESLNIAEKIIKLPRLNQDAIASIYHKAQMVLLPSEAEGFGLPVIEALACKTIVVASDIPVFREVGKHAVVYCPLADVPTWTETICRLLQDRTSAPSLETRLEQAALYSWQAHAKKILSTYEKL